MNYFPRYATLPDDRPLLQQIEAAAERLAGRFRKLDTSTLAISEYNHHYLSIIMRNLRGNLTLNAYLLVLALAHAAKPLQQTVLVDYGGGCGLFSFLAVELGVGAVIYNDIYDVSCQDARVIGDALHCPVHDYVQGDIDELVQYVRNTSLRVDAMAS